MINTPSEELDQEVDNGFEVSDDAIVSQPASEVDTSDPGNRQSRNILKSNDLGTTVASKNTVAQESVLPEAIDQENLSKLSEVDEKIAALSDEVTPTDDDSGVAGVSEEKTTKDLMPSETDDAQLTDLAEAEQNKALNELLAGSDEEPELQQEDSEGKWAIGPSIAPVYFNGLGDGSPIDQAFVTNEKSGSFNLSYGLQVSYQVNKRLQLRSGLHKVDYGYNTNDIVFSSSLQASSSAQMKNVDYSPTSEYLVVNSQNSVPSKAETGIRNEIAARNTSRAGTMVQEFGYLEVPLELNYALVDRTLGVNLISGISSLFLVDNAVSLESDSGTTEVGEANNLNEVNFSANFGLGVEYKVSDKIKLQLEPLLKYQLNTFSNTAGDFRPYSIGIYSGIRYKF